MKLFMYLKNGILKFTAAARILAKSDFSFLPGFYTG